MIAKVLVDIKAKQLNKLFDYIIPSEYKDELVKGMRVIVPFGEQKRLGFILDIIDDSNYDYNKLREIEEVLDIVPSINEESFLYLDYLKQTNNVILLDIIETILPNEIFLNYTQVIKSLDKEFIPNELSDFFNKNLEAIYSNKLKEHKKIINKLIRENKFIVSTKLSQVSNAKMVQTIIYSSSDHYKNRKNYLELINYVKENPNLTRKELTNLGFNLSSINTLIKNNVFIIEEIRDIRKTSFINTDKINKHILNDEQKKSYNLIVENLDKPNTILLNGITGSGKTEVYMQVIEEVLKTNKNILYLVPEISLIPQTVNYFKSRFDTEVIHFNSRLSKGERYDTWSKIISDDAKIVVGTRSSIFLPINNLGLIIVDEEHDTSYIQTERVQYNTIDILNIKSKYHNIPIVLGSATPKVSSMYKALNKQYLLSNLTKRATNTPLPEITFVDMKEELKNGNTKIFSNVLDTKIKKALSNNEQIILLFNRKGYSSFILCRDCGHVPKCPNCDISLTYFKEDNLLKCSYCNFKKDYSVNCENCNSTRIGPVGLGVDQVYELIKKEYSNARVIKMDQDSTRTKGSHEKIWLDFREHKYDILVGTKMVSKGLDFTNVTLVGILMADMELKAPSFYAEEETYSLITQMSGRSGRGQVGETVIQGYDLNHYAIKKVSEDYNSFYNEAIYLREIKKYDPFYNVIQIVVSNESYLKSYQDTLNIKKELEKIYSIVLGPSEPLIKYIKNEFIFTITIKSREINYKEIYNIVNNYKDSKIKILNTPQVL